MATPPVQEVKFNNTARPAGVQYGQDWFEWKVYVDEPKDVLQRIEAVEYLLHRTFPNPLRKVTNANTKFALSSSGWGEFNIFITVFFKNGARLETSYYLKLADT